MFHPVADHRCVGATSHAHHCDTRGPDASAASRELRHHRLGAAHRRATGGPVGLATDLELPEPDPQPADAPPPGDVTEAPAETPQVSNIAYTKKLWQAIRAQDVCGNDALDSLAQPYVIG